MPDGLSSTTQATEKRTTMPSEQNLDDGDIAFATQSSDSAIDMDECGKKDFPIWSGVDLVSIGSGVTVDASVRSSLRYRARKLRSHTALLKRKIAAGYHQAYLKWCVGTILFITICVGAIHLYETSDVSDFFGWVEKAPIWTVTVVCTVMYFFVSLPIGWGYICINMLQGYLYAWWGLPLTMVSAMIGTVSATLTCKYFLHDYVHSKVEGYPTMSALLRVVNRPNSQSRVIILSRLSPFPYGLQNAVFSLSNVDMITYASYTLVGCIPMQVVNTYMGTTLRDIRDVLARRGEVSVFTYAVFAAQLVVGILLLAGVLYATKVEFNKMVENSPVNDIQGASDIESGLDSNSDSDAEYIHDESMGGETNCTFSRVEGIDADTVDAAENEDELSLYSLCSDDNVSLISSNEMYR
ncbi:hypothetical protein SARC_02242 [Sphaeroforma arctica JP610]|uniref:VTT domain-containing protein n=1 Tax=Sphaeroforma arctica JP610 TaxID=667725 RepID=A0A0L0G9C6_9EUKA|nr:hypothetical protein SARC_02242 [Sphaeroforma arctica JP610]KNC85585.1 hypothetical protein SARC_02242 [Sphaeroforma arctica JP610]|eukprot:XP_014159487.1 hypothetical protein SARC_02242 [Sphaeroforma arctica JP610]